MRHRVGNLCSLVECVVEIKVSGNVVFASRAISRERGKGCIGLGVKEICEIQNGVNDIGKVYCATKPIGVFYVGMYNVCQKLTQFLSRMRFRHSYLCWRSNLIPDGIRTHSIPRPC